ncbi:tol-pal system protein YbgF [Devosia sp. FJ2-5-3]|uniref:tol-pal system protein YbgF n=1 Tax=Devosia sp. FJ2-5-3 TaxID=2976680 RepID=UPI0023D7F36B|nr:tol-pal system protein YbgF [Devosia sp. FJ2-5-3]WEJ59147.1 tol-pal system protein YbgF [Devosia sp. FJ2-5-3]
MNFGIVGKKLGAGICAMALGMGGGSATVMAQSAFPPAELQGLAFNNTQPGRVLVAQADSAQLMVRIQQLEEQLRSLNGQIEGLTFQLTQMQEIINRMQEDNEFRFQALEGGAGGKTDAATQPGSVTQPEALPQTPAQTEEAPATVVPSQGVQPLPGEQEFDPTFDQGQGAPEDDLGASADPLVGTGRGGAVDLVTGQPLNLSYDPRAPQSGNADADAQFTAGYEALSSGDYAFAEDQFSQFVELYPNSPRVTDAANFLGEALLARGAYDRAAEVLLEAFEKQPENTRAPDLLLKLGIALAGAGERETACRTFDEVSRRFAATQPAFTSRLAEERAKAACPPA